MPDSQTALTALYDLDSGQTLHKLIVLLASRSNPVPQLLTIPPAHLPFAYSYLRTLRRDREAANALLPASGVVLQ